ncbi:hypothetical protein [Quadrisphaera sp. DSM 44207]|nr:hypothetical protein [Quadrisphaera sp. DSM 44207]SDQ06584.1 hypothetical protein SAMN05428996_0310 [Quadrisphaera sp. DSM 44207]
MQGVGEGDAFSAVVTYDGVPRQVEDAVDDVPFAIDDGALGR